MARPVSSSAADQRQAGLLGIAWHVEQVAQSLGIIDRMTDENGDGPFIQKLKEFNS